MRRKNWEIKIKQELKDRLLKPRVERILAILNGKKPKRLSQKEKRQIKKILHPLIEEAIRKKYKKELKKLQTKSFRLPPGSAHKTKDAIKRKINEYKTKKDIKLRRLVYTLWKDRNKCLYVGQTKRGLSEIISKRKRLYRESTILKIYLTDKSHLDRYEGIAYHVLVPKGKRKPKYNAIQSKNFRKKCPFCIIKRKVDREIDLSFVLKRKK